MIIARLETTHISDLDEMTPEMGRLFHGVWAHRHFGGNPMFFGVNRKAHPVPPDQKLFELINVGDQSVGGVLVSDINSFHRRAAIHVSVFPNYWQDGHARRGLILACTILGESFGIECFYTYVIPDSLGHHMCVTGCFEEWGRLKDYTLTPNGRSDTLLMGGKASDLREKFKDSIDAIDWRGA